MTDLLAALHDSGHYCIHRAHVPVALLRNVPGDLAADVDGLTCVDIEVKDGLIEAIRPAKLKKNSASSKKGMMGFNTANVFDVAGGIVFPTFADLHTHIDKGHTCERSRNPNGALSGADMSTAADAVNWSHEDVERRMEFSLRAAYAHGTCALRTHLMSGRYQAQFSWPAFAKLRDKWKGRVELQGVALVVLAYFRDMEAATALADSVQEYGGILGAAVSCSDKGGLPTDDITTCGADMPMLLDRMFELAKSRNLDLDFHVDENQNPESKGLRYISEATIRHGYQGRVVCGHCCSLVAQSPEDLAETLRAAKAAGVCVVSLPIVNLWLQNRDEACERTPVRRGVTLLKELHDYGIPVALASDNTRDQFYAYGDLDLLHVFRESCCIGHLDRPGLGSWPGAVTDVPARAMRLPAHVGLLAVGKPADLVVFRGRCYTELFSRPQTDRVVVRAGRPVQAQLPQYTELDRALPSPVSVPAMLADPQSAAAAAVGGGRPPLPQPAGGAAAAAAGRAAAQPGARAKGAVITATGRRAGVGGGDSFRMPRNGLAGSPGGSGDDGSDTTDGGAGPTGRVAAALGDALAWWLGRPPRLASTLDGDGFEVGTTVGAVGPGPVSFAAGVVLGGLGVWMVAARSRARGGS